jgi:hypothetical protein
MSDENFDLRGEMMARDSLCFEDTSCFVWRDEFGGVILAVDPLVVVQSPSGSYFVDWEMVYELLAGQGDTPKERTLESTADKIVGLGKGFLPFWQGKFEIDPVRERCNHLQLARAFVAIPGGKGRRWAHMSKCSEIAGRAIEGQCVTDCSARYPRACGVVPLPKMSDAEMSALRNMDRGFRRGGL